MSFANGPLSIRRYQVLTPPRNIKMQDILDKMKSHFISPLTVDDSREESSGFCHPFSGDSQIPDAHSLNFDSAFLFGMRFDKKNIPSVFLRIQMRQALKALGFTEESPLDSAQNQGKKVSKKIRDDLKEKIKGEILKATLPAIKIVEVLWQTETNEVWFFSQSKKHCLIFEALFAEAFGLEIVSLNQGTIPIDWDRVNLGLPVKLEKMIQVLPSLFASSQLTDSATNSDDDVRI